VINIEDWPALQARWGAWWQGEDIGRAGLWVTAPRERPSGEPPAPPEDTERYWTDWDYWARRVRWEQDRTYYGGEAFPCWGTGYPGHLTLATYLGCPITLDRDTGWIEPILAGDSWDVEALRIDPRNRWWKTALEHYGRMARECYAGAGRTGAPLCVPHMGAFGGAGDTLSWLRGNEALLMDCVERPDLVRRTEARLMELWCEVYDRFYGLVSGSAGVTSYVPCWSPGKFFVTMCDFAYMISPGMFRELFLPGLAMQTEFLDYAVHHVDGKGNFAHVPALCELPRLRAIQILPGSGQPGPLHWMELLELVQSRGKNLWIGLEPADVPRAIRELSPRGLMIQTNCATEAEARRLVAEASSLSR
jgi:hypothetical protein